jgi:hypothetical protein
MDAQSAVHLFIVLAIIVANVFLPQGRQNAVGLPRRRLSTYIWVRRGCMIFGFLYKDNPVYKRKAHLPGCPRNGWASTTERHLLNAISPLIYPLEGRLKLVHIVPIVLGRLFWSRRTQAGWLSRYSLPC